MKHDTNYKFNDKICTVKDFCAALDEDYSTGVLEVRALDNKPASYLLTIYSDGGCPHVQYSLCTLDDCLQIATSRVDFMYHLVKRGYLVAAN